MKSHKLAKLFPEITGADFKALVLDIKTNGLRQKITMLDGDILDGANRYRACVAADVEPLTEEYKGDDPLAFVISQNLSRRQLTDDQRAAIAAEIATAKAGNPANSAVLKSETTIKGAATSLKVSPRQVARAKSVKKESPAAFRKVKSGEMSLNKAHEKRHPRKPREVNPPPSKPKEREKKSSLPNPVLPVDMTIDSDEGFTLAEFKKLLDRQKAALEKQPKNAEKFADPAMRFAEWAMNADKPKKGVFAYGR